MIYENIKAICNKKGISVNQLEQQAGLCRGTISKWNKSSPTVENLKAVADVLKVKMEKLL